MRGKSDRLSLGVLTGKGHMGLLEAAYVLYCGLGHDYFERGDNLLN